VRVKASALFPASGAGYDHFQRLPAWSTEYIGRLCYYERIEQTALSSIKPRRTQAMRIKDYQFPDELYYDCNHYWAKVEGGLVVMGTTDLARKLAGEITFVDVPVKGDGLKQGKPFGSIESGKWVGRVYAVVSGTVAEGNQDLEDEPELINTDCYGKGWIVKIKPGDLEAELKNLLKGAAYKKWVAAEIARLGKEIKNVVD
jgi:glycine cleavage system H protein